MHHHTRQKKLKCLYASTATAATTSGDATSTNVTNAKPAPPLKQRIQFHLITIFYCVAIEVFSWFLIFFNHIKKLRTEL